MFSDDEVFYIVGTPQALDKLLKDKALKAKLPKNYILDATSWVYMNLDSGWTTEECDNVVYILNKTWFDRSNQIKLEFPI